jgi:hypothetical protein
VQVYLIRHVIPETDFPPLELNISYTDIHSKRISKDFHFNPQFDFIATPGDNVKELAKFRVEVRELVK